jgi:hypothetical protein
MLYILVVGTIALLGLVIVGGAIAWLWRVITAYADAVLNTRPGSRAYSAADREPGRTHMPREVHTRPEKRPALGGGGRQRRR